MVCIGIGTIQFQAFTGGLGVDPRGWGGLLYFECVRHITVAFLVSFFSTCGLYLAAANILGHLKQDFAADPVVVRSGVGAHVFPLERAPT